MSQGYGAGIGRTPRGPTKAANDGSQSTRGAASTPRPFDSSGAFTPRGRRAFAESWLGDNGAAGQTIKQTINGAKKIVGDNEDVPGIKLVNSDTLGTIEMQMQNSSTSNDTNASDTAAKTQPTVDEQLNQAQENIAAAKQKTATPQEQAESPPQKPVSQAERTRRSQEQLKSEDSGSAAGGPDGPDGNSGETGPAGDGAQENVAGAKRDNNESTNGAAGGEGRAQENATNSTEGGKGEGEGGARGGGTGVPVEGMLVAGMVGSQQLKKRRTKQSKNGVSGEAADDKDKEEELDEQDAGAGDKQDAEAQPKPEAKQADRGQEAAAGSAESKPGPEITIDGERYPGLAETLRAKDERERNKRQQQAAKDKQPQNKAPVDGPARPAAAGADKNAKASSPEAAADAGKTAKAKSTENKDPAPQRDAEPLDPQAIVDAYVSGDPAAATYRFLLYILESAKGTVRPPETTAELLDALSYLSPSSVRSRVVASVFAATVEALGQLTFDAQFAAAAAALLSLYATVPVIARHVEPATVQTLVLSVASGLYARRYRAQLNLTHVALVARALKATSASLGPGTISSILDVLPEVVDLADDTVRRAMYAVGAAAFYAVYGPPKNPEVVHHLDPRAGVEWIIGKENITAPKQKTALRQAGSFIFKNVGYTSVLRMLWDMRGWSVPIVAYIVKQSTTGAVKLMLDTAFPAA